MKYVAIVIGSGNPNSGIKDTREDAERWLENQLLTSKATHGYVFETIFQMSTEPRTIRTTDLRTPTEENTRPEPKPSVATKTLIDTKVFNGHDPASDHPDVYVD